MRTKKNYSAYRKLFHTILVLLILRVFYSIPTPGVNTGYFKTFLELNASFSFINAITGSGLSDLSIMALSVGPYITASILVQLFGILIPKLAEMQNGMQDERDRIEKLTSIVGIIMAVLQSVLMAIGFGKKGLLIDYKWYWICCITAIWTFTSAMVAFIGKKMSDMKNYFIGNGVSLILTANIIASYPSDIKSIIRLIASVKDDQKKIIISIVVITAIVILFMFTYFINGCEKQIKIVYSNKTGGGEGTIPIKLCTGGVVPVIFASSIMAFPVTIASLIGKENIPFIKLINTACWFDPKSPIYSFGAFIYLLLIILYSYFYTNITFNASEVAHSIQKSDGIIPGIRSGQNTVAYLKRQMKSLIFIGAICMSIIAMVPIFISAHYGLSRLSFLGTSVIITVSVIIDTKNQVLSQRRSKKYIARTV